MSRQVSEQVQRSGGNHAYERLTADRCIELISNLEHAIARCKRARKIGYPKVYHMCDKSWGTAESLERPLSSESECESTREFISKVEENQKAQEESKDVKFSQNSFGEKSKSGMQPCYGRKYFKRPRREGRIVMDASTPTGCTSNSDPGYPRLSIKDNSEPAIIRRAAMLIILSTACRCVRSGNKMNARASVGARSLASMCLRKLPDLIRQASTERNSDGSVFKQLKMWYSAVEEFPELKTGPPPYLSQLLRAHCFTVLNCASRELELPFLFSVPWLSECAVYGAAQETLDLIEALPFTECLSIPQQHHPQLLLNRSTCNSCDGELQTDYRPFLRAQMLMDRDEDICKKAGIVYLANVFFTSSDPERLYKANRRNRVWDAVLRFPEETHEFHLTMRLFEFIVRTHCRSPDTDSELTSAGDATAEILTRIWTSLSHESSSSYAGDAFKPGDLQNMVDLEDKRTATRDVGLSITAARLYFLGFSLLLRSRATPAQLHGVELIDAYADSFRAVLHPCAEPDNLTRLVQVKVPTFLCSLISTCNREEGLRFLEHISAVLDKSFQRSENGTASSGIYVLDRIVMETAVLYASKTENKAHRGFALNLIQKSRDRLSAVKATPSKIPHQRRWEEGISEWVTATPIRTSESVLGMLEKNTSTSFAEVKRISPSMEPLSSPAGEDGGTSEDELVRGTPCNPARALKRSTWHSKRLSRPRSARPSKRQRINDRGSDGDDDLF